MGPAAVIFSEGKDEGQDKYTVVMSERRMYMDAPTRMVKPKRMAKPLMTRYWRLQEGNDACPEWNKTAEQAGTYKNRGAAHWGGCMKMGSDSLNRRSTVNRDGFLKTKARRVLYG